MAITGGIKTFEQPVGAVITANTNNSTAAFMLKADNRVNWNGGSSDTISLSFGSTSINRIIIAEHNLENYTIQYDNNGVMTDFTNITSLTGAISKIDATAYSSNTSYYEFDPVTTNKIELIFSANSTNAKISFLCITTEIGTFEFDPKIKDSQDRNIIQRKDINKRYMPSYGLTTFKTSLSWKNNNSQADCDLITKLHNRINPFLIWLSGGKVGQTEGIAVDRQGMRLHDVYLVSTLTASNTITRWWALGFNAKLKLAQAAE
jgi:hypothetical protein